MTKFLQNAGKYRNPITIQQQSTTVNEYGEPIQTWTTFASPKAGIFPISGKQYLAAEVVESEITHQVHLRYIPGITDNMRIQYGTRTFIIITMVNFQEMNKEIQLLCKEYSS